jgi:hypothetical protein
VNAHHEPVLLAEVLAFLANGAGLYLDATLGDGGHATALLEREPEARLWGNDRDPAALAASEQRLGRFGGRVMLTHGTFAELAVGWERFGREPLAGALFDLGLSSRQLDDPARGISFRHDAPLDLRFDPGHGEPASERLAGVEAEELERLLREHGDVAGAGRSRGAGSSPRPARSPRCWIARSAAARIRAVRRRCFRRSVFGSTAKPRTSRRRWDGCLTQFAPAESWSRSPITPARIVGSSMRYARSAWWPSGIRRRRFPPRPGKS